MAIIGPRPVYISLWMKTFYPALVLIAVNLH